MTDQHDPAQRDRWARLRFAIVGPLLAAPPAAGELQAALQALSAKSWQHPTSGMPMRFALSTIERWYYAARRAKQDPVAALKTQIRTDAGSSRVLPPPLIEALHAQYREHPSWSVQLHYDNLRAALGEAQLPSYASVRRYFRSHALDKQPHRARRTASANALVAREVRSFEVEHVNALWHLDFHHGSRKVLTSAGSWVKPMALCILDDRSRLACHIQWYYDETARSLVHGFSQALQRRALPRALLSDNGAAMLAEEFTNGLHALGIVHETTLPYSPHQNGKQERLWGSVEGRLIAMLEGVSELTLELLNTATHAWIEHEYHRSRHAELGCTPLERYAQGPDVGRECPASEVLRRAFRLEVSRTQRRSDGTVTLEGCRFEVPSRYRHLKRLRLRHARWDLASVDLIDARSGAILCALYPLDKSRNAQGARRTLEPLSPESTSAPAPGIAPLLRKLMADYAATGLPPAYLPTES